MTDTDKPFIMYKAGWGNMKIVPKNAQGWRETIIWMLLLIPVLGPFTWWIMQHREGDTPIAGILLFMAGMTAWGLGGIIWMYRRSEVVDLDELLALKRERDAEKRRGRR